MKDLDSAMLYNNEHIKAAHKARARYLRAIVKGLWSSMKADGSAKKGPTIHGGAAG